jgi:probable addiction module antidote protein
MPLETTKFDIQDFLKTPEDRAAYIEAALEDGDVSLITHALGDVARAVGMSDVAREAGITREGLYKALSDKGDPRLSTLLGVMRALGLQLSARAANDDHDVPTQLTGG